MWLIPETNNFRSAACAATCCSVTCCMCCCIAPSTMFCCRESWFNAANCMFCCFMICRSSAFSLAAAVLALFITSTSSAKPPLSPRVRISKLSMSNCSRRTVAQSCITTVLASQVDAMLQSMST